MAIQMNIAEAKAKLSELIDAAQRGQEVIIARAGRAVARITPVAAPASRELGFVDIEVDDALFDPIDPADIAGWE